MRRYLREASKKQKFNIPETLEDAVVETCRAVNAMVDGDTREMWEIMQGVERFFRTKDQYERFYNQFGSWSRSNYDHLADVWQQYAFHVIGGGNPKKFVPEENWQVANTIMESTSRRNRKKESGYHDELGGWDIDPEEIDLQVGVLVKVDKEKIDECAYEDGVELTREDWEDMEQIALNVFAYFKRSVFTSVEGHDRNNKLAGTVWGTRKEIRNLVKSFGHSVLDKSDDYVSFYEIDTSKFEKGINSQYVLDHIQGAILIEFFKGDEDIDDFEDLLT